MKKMSLLVSLLILMIAAILFYVNREVNNQLFCKKAVENCKTLDEDIFSSNFIWIGFN